MADITVESGYNNNLTNGQARLSGRDIVFITDDIGYFFFFNSGRDYCFKKTTDGGATWGTAVVLTAYGATETTMWGDIWYDQWTPGNSGGLIHSISCSNTLDLVAYRSVNTASSDTLSSQTTVFDGASAVLTNVNQASITRAIGGNIVVAGSIDGGTENFCFKSTDVGATWVSRAALFEAGANDMILLFPGDYADTQDIDCLYYDNSAQQISLKTLDDSLNSVSETTFGGTVNIGGSFAYGPRMAGAIRHSDNHLIVIFWNLNDNATSDLLCYDLHSQSSITQLTNIITNIANVVCCCLFIDQNTNDIYCGYIGTNAGSQNPVTSAGIYYVISTNDGSTWGTQVQYSAVTNTTYNSVSCPMGGTNTRFEIGALIDATTDLLVVNFDNSIAITSGGDPVTESMALATASAASLAITAAIKAQMANSLATASLLQATGSLIALMELKAATAEHLVLTNTESKTEELAVATADAIALASVVSIVGSMAKATANAELLALVSSYKETLATMTASGAHLSITAFIKASMAVATASAAHLSLTLFADMTEQMATSIATAEHLSITSKINALLALSTATAEFLALRAGLGLATDKATASAVQLSITAAINATLGVGTATAVQLPLTTSTVTFPTVATASAIHLAITAAIKASMGVGTASATEIALLLGLGLLPNISTASAIHLPLTDEVIIPDQSMGRMTADAAHLQATAAINSLMGIGTADAVHLALTMAAILLMEKQTATAEHLELLVGLSQSMNLQTASAVHMPITAAFQALMGIGAAEAIMLALTDSQNDVVNQMALSTASAELLTLVASLSAAMGSSTATAQMLGLLGSINALMNKGTADAEHLAITTDIETLFDLGLATAQAIQLEITAAINGGMSKATADAVLLSIRAAINTSAGIATASAISLPIEAVLLDILPGTMTASGIFLPSIGAINALLGPMTASPEMLPITVRIVEIAQNMQTMTASARMLALIVDFLVGAILDGCVDLDLLIDKNAWISHVQSSGYIKPIVQSIPSGYIKDPTKNNPWDF